MKKLRVVLVVCILLSMLFTVSCSELLRDEVPPQTLVDSTLDDSTDSTDVNDENDPSTETHDPYSGKESTEPSHKLNSPEGTTDKNSNEEVHTHKLDLIEKKDATCTEKGNFEYWFCSECGIAFSDKDAENEIEDVGILPIGHDYASTHIDPTCSTDGYTLHKCKTCGDEYNSDIIQAHGHEYSEWETITSATCTQSGTEKRVCSVCGEKEEKEINPTGHDYDITIIDPICTSDGYTLCKCKKCNDDFTTDKVQAHGHKFGEWKIVTSATCTQSGIEKRVCGVCNAEEEQEISSTSHSYDITVKEPSCASEGYTLHKCLTCSVEYKSDIVKAQGHEYGEWEIVTSATCTQSGKKQRICTLCDEKEEQEISPTGHDYEITVIDPTCTSDGYTLCKCKRCSDVFITDKVQAHGHKFGEWETVTYATCTQSGTEKRVCRVCDEKEEQEISPTDHSYEITVKEPTCSSDGYTLHKCKTCAEEYKRDITVATGHRFSDEWKYDSEGHWHEAICGCEIETEKTNHEFNDDCVCECGYEEQWEYRLQFKKNGVGYEVSGIEVNEKVEKASLEIVIPSEYCSLAVTGIADYAFKGNEYITSVTIPNTIRKIGKGAFADSSVTNAKFEKKNSWKVSINADGRASTTVTVNNETIAAKLLKTAKRQSGYSEHYWFN